MECLLQCRNEYDAVVSLANEGRLAEAVETSTRLQGLLDAVPPALTEAEVFSNLKVWYIWCNAMAIIIFWFSRLGCVQDRKRPRRRTA
jgi:hypothetical protein